MDIINIDHLLTISERLRSVQIECRSALTVIEDYDHESGLIYLDPPYPKSERRKKAGYGDTDQEDGFHIQAANLLRRAKGFVVISGYACPLYTELYEAHGWQRFDKEAQANSGTKRIESLWLSPRTTEALSGGSVPGGLFEWAANGSKK